MKKQLIIGITVLFIVSCFVYVLSELYSAKILVPPDLKAGLNPAADVSSETEKMSPDEARQNRIRQLAEEGKSITRIAEITGYSYPTVKKYLGR